MSLFPMEAVLEFLLMSTLYILIVITTMTLKQCTFMYDISAIMQCKLCKLYIYVCIAHISQIIGTCTYKNQQCGVGMDNVRDSQQCYLYGNS